METEHSIHGLPADFAAELDGTYDNSMEAFRSDNVFTCSVCEEDFYEPSLDGSVRDEDESELRDVPICACCGIQVR